MTPSLSAFRDASEAARVVEPGYEQVARAFDRLVSGSAGGGALVIRRRGENVVSVARGESGSRGSPWTVNTVALSFSTTKGVASTVIHRLVDRGEVDLDEPIAAFWPEFAAGGKGDITVRDLLCHRAGLWDVRAVAARAEDMLDHEAVEDRLAALPSHRTRRPAYHAITFGWLVAGLARRVTGRGLRDLVRTELAEPLGTDGLSIGPPDTGDVADILGLTLRRYGRAARIATPLTDRLPPARTATRALLVPGFHRLFEGGSPAIWGTEMPAVNGYLSADGLARMYGALANGGTDAGCHLLSPEAVTEAGRVQSRDFDAVLGMRMRWRVGYHQAFGCGAGSSRCFGHYGYAGSGGWADPDLGVSLGFVTNNVSRLTTPIGDFTLFRLSALARQAALGR